MTDPRFRVRIERLLRGDFRADDLKTLFLHARDRCYGSLAVRDVGDFIAHHNERDQGVVTRSTCDWFTVARFMAPRHAPNTPPLDEWRLPTHTPSHLQAAFNRKTPASLKSSCGMSMKAGRGALKRLLRRFENNLDGTLRLSRFILPDEHKLFRALTSATDATYAFSGETLFADFQKTMLKNKLLQEKEIDDFRSISQQVVLLAASVMHNNQIIMEDKSRVPLWADKNTGDGLIQVFADVTAMILGHQVIVFSSPIFGGEISIGNTLAEKLINDQKWNYEIELRDDGKLHALI